MEVNEPWRPFMADQRIEPLNDAEQQWVAAELRNARQLVDRLVPADAGAAMTPQVLDRAYKAARQSAGHGGQGRQDADAANAIINAVGIAFGQHLVDQLGFTWVAVFDEHGSEIAVVGLPGQANMLVFPPNLVAKRWAAGTVDFLAHVCTGIEDDLMKLKAAWAAAPSPPPGSLRSSDEAAGKWSWLRKWLRRDPGR
jgi:hypothetical protein